MLNNKDRIGSMLLLVFSFLYLRYAIELPLDPTAGDESFSARTLPIGLSIAAIVFALLEIFLSTRRAGDRRISISVQGFNWAPTLLLVLSMGIYSVVFDTLGFIVSSFLFLQSGFLILGERRLLLSGVIAAGLVGALWLILAQMFSIFLDPGDLYRMLVE